MIGDKHTDSIIKLEDQKNKSYHVQSFQSQQLLMAGRQSFCFVTGGQWEGKLVLYNLYTELVVLNVSVLCHLTANPHPHHIAHGRWYQQRLYSERDQHIRPDNR